MVQIKEVEVFVWVRGAQGHAPFEEVCGRDSEGTLKKLLHESFAIRIAGPRILTTVD